MRSSWLVVLALAGCGKREPARHEEPRPQPTPVIVDAAMAMGPRPIAIGMTHRSALALIDDGTVRAWGNGQFGMLGTGKAADSATPVVVPGVTGATSLVVDSNSPVACAHLATGSWSCWGFGDGLPSGKDEIRTPAVVPAFDGMRSVKLASWFGCGIEADRHVACWGRVPPRDPALPNLPLARVAGLHDAIALAIGSANICVVQADGSVWCWGKDDYAQTSATVEQPKDDRVVATPTRIAGIDDAVDVVMGVATSCVRRRSGELACWGRPFGLRGVVPIASEPGARLLDADRLDVCEAMKDGQIRCIATMGRANCSGGRTIQDIDNCLNTELPYMNGDQAWHTLPLVPASALATDYDSNCALGLDGQVWCWGKNDVGQLGDGTLVARDLAKPVVSLVQVVTPVAPPAPPPSPAARGTSWDKRPSDCAYDEKLDVKHAALDSKPFEVRAAFARIGELVDIDLHDHLVDPKDVGHPPTLSADQRSIRLLLANETADGFAAVTPGRFTVKPGQRGRSGGIVIENAHTYGDVSQAPHRMDGTITITRLGGGWVCGRVDVAGPAGHLRGRFAAEVP
ncbi:MAG TPA: hypothetical protein VL326_22295 [Kofleriaceae bacterium]|nr:hypothetical protein [Kofleriaceae bacterium]